MATLIDWKTLLVAKMAAEEIRDLTAPELERVFAGCVSETLCVKYSRELIEQGLLTMADVYPPTAHRLTADC